MWRAPSIQRRLSRDPHSAQLIDTVLPLLLRPCRPPPLITHGYKWALSPLAIMMLVFQFIWLRHLLLWNVAKHSRGIELTSWREREEKNMLNSSSFLHCRNKTSGMKKIDFWSWGTNGQFWPTYIYISIYIYLIWSKTLWIKAIKFNDENEIKAQSERRTNWLDLTVP